MKCPKCKEETWFSYLETTTETGNSRHMATLLYGCPRCGARFTNEELIMGKMRYHIR